MTSLKMFSCNFPWLHTRVHSTVEFIFQYGMLEFKFFLWVIQQHLRNPCVLYVKVNTTLSRDRLQGVCLWDSGSFWCLFSFFSSEVWEKASCL